MLPWQIKAFKDILELFAPDADEDSSDNEIEGKEFVGDDAINLKKPGNVRMDDWTKFINKLVTDLWLKVKQLSNVALLTWFASLLSRCDVMHPSRVCSAHGMHSGVLQLAGSNSSASW
jgi:hypothetical protein